MIWPVKRFNLLLTLYTTFPQVGHHIYVVFNVFLTLQGVFLIVNTWWTSYLLLCVLLTDYYHHPAGLLHHPDQIITDSYGI